MKQSFLLTAALLSLSAASQAVTIWSDDYSTGRDAGTDDPNPYNYAVGSGTDYTIATAGNTFTVAGGILNIADTTTTNTPTITVFTNRFSTTTFNAGDTFTVSVDLRVNSLTAAAGNSVPRFTIFTGSGVSGAESLTVGFGYGNFTGQPANTMGFYKGGGSSGTVGAGNGIGVGSAGFDFGVYDPDLADAAVNGTDGWYRVTVTMTQGQQAYTGSITNLTTSNTASFNGGLVNALNWGDNANGGVRFFAGLGGTSNYDVDNLIIGYTAVPEPSSVALLGGLGALALLRRRRA